MKLTKIKLINWHLFTNTTMEIKGNFLLTGENGSGKSTFTDALYYLLSGGDEKCFNHAANANARRTLASYVKGKLGNEGEGKEFLRNGSDIVSHIAVELREKKHSAVFGCVIEIVDDGKPNVKFYVVQDCTIAEDDYIDGKRVLSFNEFKNRMKAKGCAISDNGLNRSFRERRKTIGRDILKLTDPERYAGLLKDAIAFRPIEEVSAFVTRFLLREDNVDIGSLMDEIRSYRELKNQLDKEEEKIRLLESFVPKAEKYHDNCERMLYYGALNELIAIQSIQSDIGIAKKNLKKTEDIVSGLEERIEKNQNAINFRKDEKRDIENDKIFRALKEKQDRLEKLKKDSDELNNLADRYRKMFDNENKIVHRFSLGYRFSEDIRNDNFPLLKEHLRSYQEEIERMDRELREKAIQNEIKIQGLKETLSVKQEELDEIKKGRNKYDEKITRLVSVIRTELEKKYRKEIEIRPLCEYLEIADERWKNALEGYLNTQRFALIIDPVYFDDALKVYEECKQKERIYGVSLFNCKHRPEEIKAEENSLFTKLIIQNRFAEFAASVLLGRVICVDSVSELKNYPAAITDTCMKYGKRMADNINPEIYRYPFIGKNSILRRREILTAEISDTEATIGKLSEETRKMRSDISVLEGSEIRQLLECKNVWNEKRECEKSISDLTAEIREDQKDKGLFEKQEKLAAVVRDIEALSAETEKLKEREKSCREKIGEYKKGIDDKMTEKAIYEDEYSEKRKKCDPNRFEKFLSCYQKDSGIDKEAAKGDYLEIQNYNNSVRFAIENGMREYVKNYAPSMSPLIENVPDFIYKYNELKDRNIIEFRDKASRAYEKSQEYFKNDFIAKLSERIKEAKDTLRNINQYLKKTPFGTDREIYQFEYDSSDEDEMKEYYRIITSGKVMEIQSLLDEALSEQEKDILKRLFDNIITEQSDVLSEQKLARYLDYRNYMKFGNVKKSV